MEQIVFEVWLIIFGLITFYALWKRNALFLLFSGLLLIAFGWLLTFQGLNVVSGINPTTGVYAYRTILPSNDGLFLIIAMSSLPLGVALSLFSLSILFDEIIKSSGKRKVTS